ncbi:hypothetical protein [Flocculibacter collagenilyticus]|uniref:hypothetical protein n=1 Tax=Flocculibacter collagenilyticus TaxID=2744479 RepID=UPI0018F47CC4|nr:hypothetical protein [Flocculibacter collagenilyticus]
MVKRLLKTGLAATTLLLAACASNDANETEFAENMYVRGAFTWWDAEEEYRLKKVGNKLYKASADLKADGQPYEFKFADAAWTAGTNCGYLNKEADEVIELGYVYNANCSAVFEHFKFVPKEDGTYDFYIDFSDDKSPMVFIKKVG